MSDRSLLSTPKHAGCGRGDRSMRRTAQDRDPSVHPVEVLLGSPEHHLCDTTYVNEAALAIPRVEFVVEALFVAGEIPEFEAVLGREPTAMAHILALRHFKHSEILERAQHLARVVAAHLAAKVALA